MDGPYWMMGYILNDAHFDLLLLKLYCKFMSKAIIFFIESNSIHDFFREIP